MEFTQPVNVVPLEPVLLYMIRLNRGDSGLVVKSFYYLDPDIAQKDLDREPPENRFSKVVPVHGLHDKVAGKFYVAAAPADIRQF